MSTYIGTTVGASVASITLDLQSLVSRVAALLRRDDLNTEIEQWLNFSMRELALNVPFPELRVKQTYDLMPTPVSPVTLPEDYFKLSLATDYSFEDRVYYRNLTDPNNVWGRNLVPLPRVFYAGDTVDIERLLNTSSPSVGDPRYYWIDGSLLKYYPALEVSLTGKIDVTYYKIPPDMTLATHEPAIENKYRHYLIWMALFWGKTLLEQGSDAAGLVRMWERKFEKTMATVKSLVNRKENKSESLALPETGLERADEIYG